MFQFRILTGQAIQITYTVTTTSPQITGIIGAPFFIGSTGLITIEGTNFGSGGGVTIGGVPMTPIVGGWTSTSITGTIPNNAVAGSQNVVVTVGGVPSNSDSIICYPYITGISPTLQMQGNAVTISGYGFGASQGTSSVEFTGGVGGTAAPWTNTSITVTVPNNASTGPVTVVVNPGSWVSNGVNLTVTANTNAHITSVTPARYLGDSGVNVTVNGAFTNFINGSTQAYITGITVNSVHRRKHDSGNGQYIRSSRGRSRGKDDHPGYRRTVRNC